MSSSDWSDIDYYDEDNDDDRKVSDCYISKPYAILSDNDIKQKQKHAINVLSSKLGFTSSQCSAILPKYHWDPELAFNAVIDGNCLDAINLDFVKR